MAKNFKSRLQGGRFEELQVGGQAELRNMAIQSEKQITALQQNRQRQAQLDASSLQSLRRVADNETANRKIIQDLENKQDKLQLESHQLRAKREVANLVSKAKQKEKDAAFWNKFSPTLAKQLGAAATGIYKFVDIQRGIDLFRKIEAGNGFETFEAGINKLEEQSEIDKLQQLRADRLNNLGDPNASDDVDYLGHVHRSNGLYFNKLVADRVRQDLPAHIADLNKFISDYNQDPKNKDSLISISPEQVSDVYEFRAQELLRKYGIDAFSPAGMEIQKMFREAGSKDQATAILTHAYTTYEANLKRDKENFNAYKTQENFDQMITTIQNGYSKDRFGVIRKNRGIISPKDAYEMIAEEALTTGTKYVGADGFHRFKEDYGKWLTPKGPGNTVRKPWEVKNPKMFEVGGYLHDKWLTYNNKLKESNEAINTADDTAAKIKFDTDNRSGALDGPDKFNKLVALYEANEGNVETQTSISKAMLLTQTSTNKGTIDQVMKTIKQNDYKEFYNIIDGLTAQEIGNIVDAAPFAQKVDELRQGIKFEFDDYIDTFATSIVKQMDAQAFTINPAGTTNANEAISATKSLYYDLFTNRFGNEKDLGLRKEKTEKYINDLATQNPPSGEESGGIYGRGIFRRMDATVTGGNVVFTSFYNGTMPNGVVKFGKGQDVEFLGRTLPDVLQSVKSRGMKLVSESDLNRVATDMRQGKDSITLPLNLRILERQYPQFDARRYMNEEFRTHENLKKEFGDIFIPPNAYTFARRAAAEPLKQEDTLAFLLGAYGPFTGEMGRHGTMSPFAMSYSPDKNTAEIASEVFDLPELSDENFVPMGEMSKTLIEQGSQYGIFYNPYGTGGWFEP